MNWASFTSGMVLAAGSLLGLYLSLPEVPPVWRQCAPAQDGEALATTTQYSDRTECAYIKRASGRVVQRKRVVS